MIAKKEVKRVPIATKLNKDLVLKAKKKMMQDRKKGFKVSWRSIWENGINQYLKEKTKA